MSSQTANLGLYKPDMSDTVNTTIPQLSSNFDKIDSSLTDISLNVKNYGAKGDSTTDDSSSIQNAINDCVSKGKKLYIPYGTYKVNSPLNGNGLIGLIGESMAGTKILAGATMTTVLTNQNTSRMVIENITIDGNGLANNCIDTTYNTNGASINNTYKRVHVLGYLQTGWIADNNNDAWWYDCLAENSKNSSIGALSSNSTGGPLWFVNCNWLDDVLVGSQLTSFVNCDTKGITIQYGGFNVLNFEGGYVMQGRNNCAIYIPGTNELGPVSFSGVHIEIPNGYTLFGGTGKLHYGVTSTSCHFLNNSGTPSAVNFLASSITSTFAYCTLRFKTCRIENFNTPAVDSAGFKYDYMSSYGTNAVPITPQWIAPTLSNGWGNYGNGTPNAGYYRDQNGIVRIKGLISGGTTTSGTTLFTLPAGYRPAENHRKGTVANDAFAEIAINSDGTVQILSGTGWLSIGCEFLAEH